jgi:proteasome lid subunit RPN8/RPN11
MGFKLEIVKNCPVTNGSKGVMVMAPSLIATIAGAVRDDIEWIAYLNGTRSADGFEVVVKEFTIPQQYRSGSEAEIVGGKDGVALADDVVGVIHSHHRMGAFFSGTDTGELNPRFPSSIVVAIANNSLGFNYKAEGKVVLPCGSVGKVDFNLSVEGVERFAAKVVHAPHAGQATGLGDCQHESQDATSDPFEIVPRAACGLFMAPMPKPLAFGMEGGDDFIKVVEQCTETRVYASNSYTTGKGGLPPGKYSGGVGRKQSGLGYISDYSSHDHTSSSIGFTGTDHLTKRERKRLARAEKWAARNGEKMRRVVDTDFSEIGGKYLMDRICEGCRASAKMVKYNEEFSQWLCVNCDDDAKQITQDVLKDMVAEQDQSSMINLDGWQNQGDGWHWAGDEEDDAEQTAVASGGLRAALASMVTDDVQG